MWKVRWLLKQRENYLLHSHFGEKEPLNAEQ